MSLSLAEAYRELTNKYEDLQVLAEERRVALVKYCNVATIGYGYWHCKCCGKINEHADDCAYCRLIKEDDNGN